MVFFCCNNCSEVFKGAKVEAHKYKCNFSTVSCVDCMKDFDLNSFKSHNKCKTEDEKYNGKDYKPKELKGQKKQDDWLNKLQELINSNENKEIKFYLEKILKYDNIPRKKIKFLNFFKSSISRDERMGEKLWDLIEKNCKANNSICKNSENKTNNLNKLNEKQSNGKNLNEKSNNEIIKKDELDDQEKTIQSDDITKRKNNLENNDSCKKLKLNDKSKENLITQNVDVNCVIEKLVKRSIETEKKINFTKFSKKVLKRQQDNKMELKKFKKLLRKIKSYSDLNDLPPTEYYEKFIEKLKTKECFIINKKFIAYKL